MSMTAAKVTSRPHSTQPDLNESGSHGGDVQVLLQAVVLLEVMCVWVYVVCVVTFKSSKRLRGEGEIYTWIRIQTEGVGVQSLW